MFKYFIIEKMFLEKLKISRSILLKKNLLHPSFNILNFNRFLTNVNLNAPSVNTHKPELIQHKWYDLWQSKLKEFNKQVQ